MSRRFLVVEDQVTNRHVVESMLRHLGIEYDSVENGREALAHKLELCAPVHAVEQIEALRGPVT